VRRPDQKDLDGRGNKEESVVPANRSLALVVRTVEVFETSLVVTLFTREMGKVAALAKGARRLKSSFQGGLDLLGVSDIVLFPKASEALDLLTEAAPVERFACLRRDLAALYAGYYIAELLTDLTDFHDPHPKLFDAARITLRHLGEAELRPRRILRFELACLRELGLMPALDQCAHCGVRPGHRRSDLPGLPPRTTPREHNLERYARVDQSPGEPRARVARAETWAASVWSGRGAADHRSGCQSCLGPSSQGLALSGSVNRWTWMPGTSVTRRDTIPCTTNRPIVQSFAPAHRYLEGP
jgi:recombinational DNA repair protein (RecF pathway)